MTNSRIERGRLRRLVERIPAGGPRALCDLLRDLDPGGRFLEPFKYFAFLDPTILAALCSVAIPVAYRLIGGEP
ncbi:MAG TPA: hypothetical protein VIF02_13385 [Methylocella sp.]